MKHAMIRLLALVMILACGLFSAAHAEDFFAIDVDALDMNSLNSDEYVAAHLSSSAQGVRVRKYISNSSELAAPVRLTIFQMDTQTLLFDRDYGYQSGTFDSGVIYLPYLDNRTVPYLVTLYIADYVYAMPFMHLQPRLQHNGACTYGVRLSDLDPALAVDWHMGTMVDLNQLRTSGGQAVMMCASNQYIIGEAYLYLSGDMLSVQPVFYASANVTLNSASLYVVADCSQAANAGLLVSQPAYAPGDWVDVTGASSVLIYMPMNVSYDPAGLSGFWYDISAWDVQSQISLFEQNRLAGQSAWYDPYAPVETLPPVETTLPVETLPPIETAPPVEVLQPTETLPPVETAPPVETLQPTETLPPVEPEQPIEAQPAPSEEPLSPEASEAQVVVEVVIP